MTESEPRSSIKPTGPEKIEESEPITDEEIAKANSLFKRKDSKEEPLNRGELAQLEGLTAKRQKEIDLIFPEFSYEVIYGLKGTPEESVKQYKAAINFYDVIIEMRKKPGTIKDFALRLEKLQNWDISPERVEIIFADKFERKRKEYIELIEKVNREKYVKFPETNEGWEAFLEKAKSRESISKGEMGRFGKAIEKQELALTAYIPQYRREGVIFLSEKAEGWSRELVNIYSGKKMRALRSCIEFRRERVEQFVSVKK